MARSYDSRSVEVLEERLRLGVGFMSRNDMLVDGYRGLIHWVDGEKDSSSVSISCFHDRVTISYRITSGSNNTNVLTTAVNLTYTNCNYGGKRAWFRCPNCDRRCLFLYLDQLWFTCRLCTGLPYNSQELTEYDRLGNRADHYRKLLKWPGGFLQGQYFKPKGMHKKTFSRLVKAHNHYARESLRLAPFCIESEYYGEFDDTLVLESYV